MGRRHGPGNPVPRHISKRKSRCIVPGCHGVMTPVANSAFHDADGSSMCDTVCEACKAEGVEYW